MRSIARHFLRAGALLLFVAALLVFSTLAAGAAPFRSPARVPRAALPASAACTSSLGTATCDLWAKTGTWALPGPTTVNIWGYADSAAGTPTLPGPVLIVNQGDTVNVTLHNMLSMTSSLAFPGQSLPADTAGVAGGGTKTYSFVASNPGTYLYEAGLTSAVPATTGQVQVAMGLFGALVVHSSTPNTAYGSAFDDESLLVLSEVDPAFSNSANPAAFDLRDYAPKYWLINGKAYPTTDPIPASSGNTLLLRYVNAGLLHHSMSLAGLHQTVLANDAQKFPFSYRATAETIPAGATLDTLATIPGTALAGMKYALFEAANHLDNNGVRTSTSATAQIVFGGMLTFVTVAGTAPPSGPVTNNVALSPNPTNGTVNVNLSASIGTAGDPAITAAEYFVDSTGANTTGCPITTGLGAAPASVSRVIPTTGGAGACVDLTTLSSGNHTFYVHGLNANGWGGFGSAVLNLDKLGPTTSLLALNPNPTNGTVDVALNATGSDVGRGNSSVDAAEYFIAPTGTCPATGGGGGAAMTPSTSGTTAQFAATIAAATVNALLEGDHLVGVHTHDVLGNWGPCTNITLHVDKTAPNTTGANATPNPTNGAIGVLVGDFLQEKLTATGTDPVAGGINSNIKAMEGFIDTPTADGTGIVFLANDAVFNSTSEGGYAGIPLFDMGSVPQGRHTIYIHSQDAAGNWGPFNTTTLDVDKTGPTTTASATNNPNNGATSVALSGSATDPPNTGTPVSFGALPIVAAEYFIDVDPGAGLGIPMAGTFGGTTVSNLSATISAATVAGLANGNHTISVRAEDAASNWGAPARITLLIDRTGPTFTSITLSSASITVGTASVNLTVNGATDPAPGSGVTGGEYWLCPPTCTNPAPGGGTAFSGLTATIPTNLLLQGHQYTVRARIHDAVGNWSTGANGVRSTTLTITPANNIFTNGFESGTLPGNWSSRSTTTASRLNATAAAALFGAFGMQAQGNNTNYVQNNSAAAATYDARFYFNPNNNASSGQDIFAAATSSGFGTQLFHVRYRRNGTQPQVQIQVGATANAAWVNITNNASNRIEVVWQSGGTLQLYVNGVSSQTLTASAGSVAAVRLGSVTSGGSATLMYFDDFASKSTASPLIGQ